MKTITHLRHPARIRSGKHAPAVLTILLPLFLTVGNAAAQDHSIIHHFTGPDGSEPTSLLLSNGTLFGTTSSGGSSNFGTVFRLNTDGTDFRVLKQFTGRDGAKPSGALVLSDATLYGRTSEGGISNCVTIFRVNTDGSDYALLKEFTDSDKANAPSTLELSGDALFGTAYNGGCSNRGSICRLNTDGSGFAVIKDFTDPVEGGDGCFEGCLPGVLMQVIQSSHHQPCGWRLEGHSASPFADTSGACF